MKKDTIVNGGISVFAVLCTCMYPILYMYFVNAGELQFAEVFYPGLVFCGCGLIIMAIAALIMKSVIKGAIASACLCVLLFNYSLLEKLVKKICPQLKYWHILPICIFVVCFIIYLLLFRISQEMQKSIAGIISIVFGALIVVNGVFAIPRLVASKSNENVDSGNTREITAAELNQELPNIYYMIFDEYSDFKVAQEYFGYDNYEFGEYLSQLGFTVSYDSVNDSYSSSTVMGNYANLEYLVVDTMTEVEKKPYRTNGYLWDLIEQGGYESSFVGVTSWFGRESAIDNMMSGTSGAETISGETFTDLIFANSAFKPFLTHSSEKVDENAEVVKGTFSYLQKVDFKGEKNHFVQSYLKCPHQPFLFDDKGNLVDSSNYNNWEDPQYYLNYYIYATNQIKLAVSHIVDVDPDAIIILQSDHSARKLVDKDGKYLIKDDDKRRILNAVYYRGTSFDEIKGQSGVNTLRLVFGRLFDMDLPVIDVPVNDPSATAMDN